MKRSKPDEDFIARVEKNITAKENRPPGPNYLFECFMVTFLDRDKNFAPHPYAVFARIPPPEGNNKLGDRLFFYYLDKNDILRELPIIDALAISSGEPQFIKIKKAQIIKSRVKIVYLHGKKEKIWQEDLSSLKIKELES
jgi:hypothetical protein